MFPKQIQFVKGLICVHTWGFELQANPSLVVELLQQFENIVIAHLPSRFRFITVWSLCDLDMGCNGGEKLTTLGSVARSRQPAILDHFIWWNKMFRNQINS